VTKGARRAHLVTGGADPGVVARGRGPASPELRHASPDRVPRRARAARQRPGYAGSRPRRNARAVQPLGATGAYADLGVDPESGQILLGEHRPAAPAGRTLNLGRRKGHSRHVSILPSDGPIREHRGRRAYRRASISPRYDQASVHTETGCGGRESTTSVSSRWASSRTHEACRSMTRGDPAGRFADYRPTCGTTFER
jgi:hypothetical protein